MKSEYESANVAIDAVIFTIGEGKLKVFLNEREKEPFYGQYELPGGLILQKESAEETLKRKLKDILSKEVHFMQFHTFTNPDRDPRRRTISIGFIALMDSDKIKDKNKWYDIGSLPKIAFDHRLIIEKAKRYLAENIDSNIVRHFMADEFPLNKLQEIYEAINDKKYDNRNFRKSMIRLGIVKSIGRMEKNVSHRPAELYKFVK
jgi:8-oxo-dGTP diphosphatase